jgi:hypothetical protein
MHAKVCDNKCFGPPYPKKTSPRKETLRPQPAVIDVARNRRASINNRHSGIFRLQNHQPPAIINQQPNITNNILHSQIKSNKTKKLSSGMVRRCCRR